MTDSDFKLPVDPFLQNSTDWYILNKEDMSDQSYSDSYKKYKNWMSDQNVIIRDIDEEFKSHLYFKDEQSMLLFALRWGN